MSIKILFLQYMLKKSHSFINMSNIQPTKKNTNVPQCIETSLLTREIKTRPRSNPYRRSTAVSPGKSSGLIKTANVSISTTPRIR